MKIIMAVLILGVCISAQGQGDAPFASLGGDFAPQAEPTTWTNTGAFARLIAGADRIVVRDGGFNCCGPVDDQKQLVVLTNVQSIVEFGKRIEFVETQKGLGGCLCCGYPGIDWYKGTNRLALTAVQHGSALRWKDFPGDAQLTPESSRALAKWLLEHGVPDLHGELKKILKKSELPTTKSTLSSEAAPSAASAER